MKSNGTHMKVNAVEFRCAACNKAYLINSTLSSKEVSIDVCSNCHPFYIGSSTGQQVKGRAEKFNKKFAAVSDNNSKTDKNKAKKSNKNVVHSLKNL